VSWALAVFVWKRDAPGTVHRPLRTRPRLPWVKAEDREQDDRELEATDQVLGDHDQAGRNEPHRDRQDRRRAARATTDPGCSAARVALGRRGPEHPPEELTFFVALRAS